MGTTVQFIEEKREDERVPGREERATISTINDAEKRNGGVEGMEALSPLRGDEWGGRNDSR
jgi:hypothetical protein